MALHPDFPESPHAIIDPSVRWLPDQSLLLGTEYGTLLPPLVHKVREQVKTWRDSNYKGASETSKALLNWWFNTPHLREQADGTTSEFQYYFAQREALETIIYLYDVVKVRDEFDLMRFDSSGAVSGNMFDESWRRFVIKMATGTKAYQNKISTVYSRDQSPPSPDDDNNMDYFLGNKPTGATTDSIVDLGDIVRDIDELMVLNDEAHHVHDSKLAWFESIADIHNSLLQKGSGLALMT